ncbi:aspartate/glutamate racemase family protein [Pseudooceanicola sp. MF1-13]|uniref:aspartate/glutamate racemase family protein n=1 Tax=Pseudooceanicola sp. MF1-13 TaxID=3379095 RepID=UPI00389266E5
MNTQAKPIKSASQGTGRRLLVVNPNGNADVTRLIARIADQVLPAGTTAHVVNPEHSPHSIQTLADRRQAEPLAIDLLARNRGYDAYVMACFDDIAVHSGRSFLGAPVVCAVEASLSVARLFAPRISIVTTVESMVPGIRTVVDALGASRTCNVRAAGIGVASAAAGGDEIERRLDDTIADARNFDGAGVVILGSGGLAGRASDLSARHGLPVIDSIEAAISLGALAANVSR